MSAKPCSSCGAVIVFGKDRETGRIIPLSVGSKVYRVIKNDEVEIDPKALVRHVCTTRPDQRAQQQHFSEPKEQQ